VVNKMSCILNAIDSEGTAYLLLDCTHEELDAVISVVGMNIAATTDAEIVKSYLYRVHISTLTGMLKRNLLQLIGLLDMDFPVTLDYQFDFSEPISDYRYPILKVKPDNSDEEFIDGFTEVKCTNPEKYDEFISWVLPKFLENANLLFGSKDGYEYYIGKTQTSTYVYRKCKFTGNLSDDLFFELQD
jgi:hypothetical protein